MNERSAYEVLMDYPKEKGLIYESHKSDTRFYLTPDDPMLNTKFVVFKINSSVFMAYDSYSTKAFMNQTFTGIYSISTLEKDFECEINKKYLLDNFRRNRKKTGNKYIDSNLTYISKSDKKVNEWLTEEISSLFLELANTIQPIKILVKKDYLPLIKDFKTKNIIGIETNQWIYKREEIDVLINSGAEIIRKLNKTSR